ncbi:MAG: polyprenyl diphosphate synthase [Bacteroidia bacterium]|nr:polyprenyl diphosphate synthase [Bacteroidia bacterium]MDW8332629.1 polyprenyl diphosphate synthase [Bacteroidia bacterium]
MIFEAKLRPPSPDAPVFEAFPLDLRRLPLHVAVIMDGNGRWAKMRGKPRVFGHRHAVAAVRETVEAAAELGIPFLTLYAFSTENQKRPAAEVSALMNLLSAQLKEQLETMKRNRIRLLTVGDMSGLPAAVREELARVQDLTAEHDRLCLSLALNYGGRAEILRAVRELCRLAADGRIQAECLTEDDIKARLDTRFLPEPELLIRTGGEKRISNFLLWDCAYTELWFTDVYWPDFRKIHFHAAVFDYQNRERRFGLTGEQIRSRAAK